MGNLFSARREHSQGEDRISELPDDILLSVMSPMVMEEAVKTSILSKRWRYLWAEHTHLDFNHLILFPETDVEILLMSDNDHKTTYKTKYINWVNQVVDLHRGPCIDTFRVRFLLDKNDAHHIDKWVRFAILKKVKHLEVNVIPDDLYSVVYTIGSDILKPSLSPGDGDISFLVSLHLNNINVSGDAIEFLLSWCRLLERLQVIGSEEVVRLKVSGLSCKLKHLTISRCHKLVELEIDAANLLSFEYYCTNRHSHLVFKSVPMLTEVELGGGLSLHLVLPQVLHLVGQLSKLSLDLGEDDIPGGFRPTLRHLKHLALLVDASAGGVDFVAITTLLESCPTMCEFKLEIAWYHEEVLGEEAYELQNVDMNSGDVDIEGDDHDYIVQEAHRNLKVLHVGGFNGCFADVEFILYFVDFASNLETIICDTKCCVYDIPNEEWIKIFKSRASKIAKVVPSRICVEII